MQNLEQQLQQTLRECERLKEENRQLKALLEFYNIKPQIHTTQSSLQYSVPSKSEKINERIQLFKDLFKGRTDIYAIRRESKHGKSGYTPACRHEWQPPICQKPNIKCSECSHRTLLPITDQVIYDHLAGKHTIGLYPLLKDDTCWFLAVDFDKKSWQQDVLAFIETCKKLNVPASIELCNTTQTIILLELSNT